MTIATNALPFGLREVVLRPIDSAGVVGAGVKLPAARTFSFSETEDFEELKGDDVTQASHGAGPVVEWDLEAGGISIAAYKVMAGGTSADTGVTPVTVRTYTKKRTDARPYFEVEGRAISDSGGDVRCVVFRCKADGSLEGEFGNGAFFLTAASGKGYGDETTDELYQFIHSETATPIVP
jgi:hypothetical protein